MSRPRRFPSLKESDVRRLGSASAFQKGMRLWDDDSVQNPMVSTQEPALFARVRDGQHVQCQVMVRHEAGDEFAATCDCNQEGICSHAVATLLAWVHRDYAFTQVEALAPAPAPTMDAQARWHQYLKLYPLQQLRALARRYDVKLKDSERDGLAEQLADVLADPETLRGALTHLDEAQRRVLQMLYLLSDGQPDTLAEEIQQALGWLELSDVQNALRELSEWGLVVSAPSQWHRSNPYTLAPTVAHLMPSVSVAIEAEKDQPFDKPRNAFVQAYAADLTSLQFLTCHHSLLEILLLARHLALQVRPAPPEPAQARSIKVLRHWPYRIDELVQLQVKPGWLHQTDSVLSAPPPEPRLDDESLARLRQLTGDDAFSEFVGHLLLEHEREPLPSDLHDIFAQWQGLASWTELWGAQQNDALSVKRTVSGAPLTYSDWLQQLARGRRFITRVLALLAAGIWYDFDSLLAFVHAIHADFLRARPSSPAIQPNWWLELNGARVEPHAFESWRASYGRFIEQVLCSPLYWLGAVELACAPTEGLSHESGLKAFQLTPTGEALLRHSPLPAPNEADAPLALHDDLRAQLRLGRRDAGAFRTLERLAQFEGVHGGCAHYRFDVWRAHAAFEAGLTADDILQQLTELSGASVPEAVCAQWQDWWSRYAQVRWYDDLSLIEFADDYILQELLSQTDLHEHLLFTFGARLVAIRPESADALARQLVKKGYTPKIE